jgi:hypothetical protein
MEFPNNPDTLAGQHSRRDRLKCIPLPHADTNTLRLSRYPAGPLTADIRGQIITASGMFVSFIGGFGRNSQRQLTIP